MAQLLDPNADGASNAWTKSTGTSGWSLLDDAVRQPTAPVTSSDHVSTSTGGAQQDAHFSTGTFVAGTWTLWTYCAGGAKRKIQYAVDVGSGFSALADLALAGAAATWESRTVSIATQAELDAFQVRYQCVSTAGGGGASAVFVYAAYLEGPAVATTTQIARSVVVTASVTPARALILARSAVIAATFTASQVTALIFARSAVVTATFTVAASKLARLGRQVAVGLAIARNSLAGLIRSTGITVGISASRLVRLGRAIGVTFTASTAVALIVLRSATAPLAFTVSASRQFLAGGGGVVRRLLALMGAGE